jgi:hypothetical protein
MKAKLQLFEKVSCMDRDFVIYVEVAEPHQPRLIHEVRSYRLIENCLKFTRKNHFFF